VRFRYHSLVNRYITKQNETVIQVQDIQKRVGAVMNEKKRRYTAAKFALNPSVAFCRMEKARMKVGNVECNASSIQIL